MCGRLAPLVLTILALLSAVPSPAAPADRARLPEFTVQPLGGLDIGDSHATAVNDKGSVVGGTSKRVGNEFRFEAFFRDKQGNVVPISDLPGGGVHTALTALNNHDWAAGSSDGG